MEQIEQKPKFNYRGKILLLFFLVIFCFVIIPALILSYSVYRFLQTEEEKIIFNLKSNMQRITSELRRNILCEKYLCRSFHEFVLGELKNKKSNIEDCINYCKRIKNFYGENIDFIVINNDGDIKYNTNSNVYKYTKEEWFGAFSYIKYVINDVYQYKIYNESLSSSGIDFARKIMGSQLVDKSFSSLFKEKEYGLIWADRSGVIPPSAAYAMKWGGFFVFVSKDLLKDYIHLRFNLLDYLLNERIIGGIFNINDIDHNFWSNKRLNNVEEIKRILKHNEEVGKYFFETEDYYISQQYLTGNNRIFSIAKKNNSVFYLYFKSLIVFIIYLILSIPIIKYFWNTIILKNPGNASIRLKLAFLFLFATGIPLLSLSVISFEYRIHKRMTMIEEAKSWSVNNILEIEQRYFSYLKTIKNDLDEYVDKLSDNIKDNGLTSDQIKSFNNKLKNYDILDFLFIASEAPVIGTVDGLIKYKGTLDTIEFDRINSILFRNVSDFRFNELRLLNILLKKICSDINNKVISGNIIKKLELFVESVFQKSFPEIIYSLLETKNSIGEFGFGSNSTMSYLKFLHIVDNSLIDYIVLVTWLPEDIQGKFVRNIIPEANRNPRNFKLIAYEIKNRELFPSFFSVNNKIERFARRASEKPTEDLEIINIDGVDYIAVSILGRNLFEFSFVGLYPLKNIDNVVDYKSYVLLLLGSFCLLLSLSLAQLLTRSFVNPMLNIQKGALAIENRNFDHRISNLNIDEFGEVGNIFNNVMVGLKELEVAKIVQESLFPNPEFKQGNFSVYGKSVTMIDVGGDYLDFFKVSDNSFSVLLGDVAGHGVGAAIIMSMAKAAILSGNIDLKSPAEVLTNLHKMILATKSAKQRKIMTFQYLHVNSETGENLYGNAGACSPFLVRHSEKKVEEIKMSGAALGAFKKAVYKEMALDFKPGDAIVFYTDGIVECKNNFGEMLGYDRLKIILSQCWDSNPETYYYNIIKAYSEFVGKDADAGDDLTIIVLIYNQV